MILAFTIGRMVIFHLSVFEIAEPEETPEPDVIVVHHHEDEDEEGPDLFGGKR